MSPLFDFGRGFRNYSAELSANYANKRALTAEAAVGELSRRVEGLALANQALFEILKTRFEITEDDVISRMAEIDARDGSKDGKMTARVVSCRRCGKKISTARLRCMFCDEIVTEGHVFQKG